MKKLPLVTVFALLTTITFAQNVTFSGQVANIIYNNCTTCHRQGAIAPFTLQNYQDVYNNRFAILNDVQNKIMPPWGPNTSYSHFLNERKLSDNDINLITNWVNNGAEEGDVAKEPKVPVFNDQSQLVNPDFSSRCSYHTVNVPDNLDDFEFFSLPSGLSINASIKQLELVPMNRKIVHHIFVFIDSTGDFTDFVNNGGRLSGNNYLSGGNLDEIKLIGGWLPGGSYTTMPDGMGINVPKNSHYIIQIHYAPGSNGQSDATQLNIIYSRDQNLRNLSVKPLLDNVVNMTDGPIFIPANQIKVFHEQYVVPADMSIVSIMPHEHKIGVHMTVYAVNPNTPTDTLRLIDDKWDFHWQALYTYPTMVHLKAGDIVYAEGTYNNTTSNRENPNYPPKDIVAGTSTLTEMMQVFFSYLPYQQGDENISLNTINNPVIPPTVDPISCTVFPNPVSSTNQLNLVMQPKATYSVEIYTIDGRLIQSYSPAGVNDKLSVSLPDLSSGLYLVKVYSADNVITQKFQVQ